MSAERESEVLRVQAVDWGKLRKVENGGKLRVLLEDYKLLPEDTHLPKSAKDKLSADDLRQTDFDLQQVDLISYLSLYLDDLKVQTAVIEPNYVDRDYLDDYTRYYARCFKPYKRMCHRIHFFSKDYAKPEGQGLSRIGKMIADPDPQDAKGKSEVAGFEKSYQGFIVIRPLPKSIIGRTCLAVNESDRTQHYKALMEVRVSFFGRELKVRCMPFMQQDSAASACATCALWSAFQITSQFFGHKHYFPGCITEMAMDHGLSESRCFPNTKGLEIPDMVHVIRSIGLDPICLADDNTSDVFDKTESALKAFDSNETLKAIVTKLIFCREGGEEYEAAQKKFLEYSGWNPTGDSFEEEKERILAPIKTLRKPVDDRYHDLSIWLGNIYAYLEAGLPVILIGTFRGEGKVSSDDCHAVAINGYHLREGANRFGNAEPWLKSSRIDKIYVHDDQIGPGEEMTLESPRVQWKTEWKTPYGKKESYEMRHILIPAYLKIRVSYEMVYDCVNSINLQIEKAVNKIGDDLQENDSSWFQIMGEKLPHLRKIREGKIPEWDIRLQLCDKFKAELRNESSLLLEDKDKIKILMESHPKYLWNICVKMDERILGRIIIDATDCGQGLHIVDKIQYEASEVEWGVIQRGFGA